MPKISVIVPVYKIEAYLNRCIDSILAQTYSDFELILVDDGSPDNCGKICDEYAGKDSRVTVIHQENGGLSAARNAGIEYALKTGSEWVSFLDSDDWVHPDYLRALYSAVTDQKVLISVCGYQKTTGKVSEITDYDFACVSPEIFWCKNRKNATVTWGKLYRKDLFQTVRCPVGKIHEDEFTTYKLLFSCKEIAITGAGLYYYYLNQNGIMKSGWTPKRLAQIDAFQEQTAYFLDHHYSGAWERSERSCLSALVEQYYAAVSSDAYDAYPPRIRASLKKEYRKYHKKLGLNIRSDTKIHQILFPLRTRLYFKIQNGLSIWKAEGIKGIFRKIISKIIPSRRK